MGEPAYTQGSLVMASNTKEDLINMGEPAYTQGSPERELIPVRSHPSLLPCPPVHRFSPNDPCISTIIRPNALHDLPSYSDYQMPQCALMEADFPKPQQPNLSLQSSLFPPGVSMQPTLQCPPDPERNLAPQVSSEESMNPSFPKYAHMEMDFPMPQHPNLSLKRCQSSLFLPGVSMQPTLQCPPDPERNLAPQVSPEDSMRPSFTMDTCLPTLGTQAVYHSHQMPTGSSASSGSEGSLGPIVPSNQYGNQQVHLEPPSYQRKERTVYSRAQKQVLQEHFDKCTYPSFNQRTELALKIGVTEYEIKIWFKNQRAKNKRMSLQTIKGKGRPQSTGNGAVEEPGH